MIDELGPSDFSRWVEPHIPVMVRLAARLIDSSDRDDVVQQALLRAWENRRQYDPKRGSPGAWLAAIVVNEARKARRRPTRVIGEIASETNSGSPDRIDLDRAVDRLAERQRLAVNCYYYVGLSVSETAYAMGCSEGTVKSTLADARKRLRNILEYGHG